MKKFIPAISATITLLTLLLSGCDARDPQQKGAKPEPASAEPEIPVFFPGQPIGDVQKLLGEPNGTIVNSNQTVLLYGRESLKFLDGRWINCQPDIRERIADGKKAAVKQAAENKTGKTATGVSGEYRGLVSPGNITVVDFYATWCGPCRQIAPVLGRLVSQQPGVVLRKVDIGNWESSVAKKYNINSVPNIRVFDKQGRMVGSPTSDPDEVARYIEQAKKTR